jgi:hypothetical protein
MHSLRREDPGATKTPIWKCGSRATASQEESAKFADFFSSAILLGRWGEAEELAKAVLFLASEDSSYFNAVELMVDGGLTALLSALPFFAANAGMRSRIRATVNGRWSWTYRIRLPSRKRRQ